MRFIIIEFAPIDIAVFVPLISLSVPLIIKPLALIDLPRLPLNLVNPIPIPLTSLWGYHPLVPRTLLFVYFEPELLIIHQRLEVKDIRFHLVLRIYGAGIQLIL